MSKETSDPETKESQPEETTEDTSVLEVTEGNVEPKNEAMPPLSNLKELLVEVVEEQLIKMRNEQSGLVQNLKDELTQTKSDFKKFKDETESKQPVQVECIVKGKYDFDKIAHKLSQKTEEEFMAHCRRVYDRINSQYPSLNEIG